MLEDVTESSFAVLGASEQPCARGSGDASQALCLKGCRARSCPGLGPAWGCPCNAACFSSSLKALFPTGGPIRGCMKGLKALGKYVDLKRMSTVGVSYGCTSDLLVSTKPHGKRGLSGRGSTRPPRQAPSPLVRTEKKHKTPRSSVPGGCGKVLHVGAHSTSKTQ